MPMSVYECHVGGVINQNLHLSQIPSSFRFPIRRNRETLESIGFPVGSVKFILLLSLKSRWFRILYGQRCCTGTHLGTFIDWYCPLVSGTVGRTGNSRILESEKIAEHHRTCSLGQHAGTRLTAQSLGVSTPYRWPRSERAT